MKDGKLFNRRLAGYCETAFWYILAPYGKGLFTQRKNLISDREQGLNHLPVLL